MPRASAPDYAVRAIRAHRALRRRFEASSGTLRREGRRRSPWTRAHLWPFIRAFVACLDLAGMPDVDGLDLWEEIDERLTALERYWNSDGPEPAYGSDVRPAMLGGDRYYDDNAWVGLALVQLERMRPGSGMVDRARQLYRFAVAGWDDRPHAPSPGGVFWVEQGRGLGRRNHDRNTVSTAPNAQLGLHLHELGEGVTLARSGVSPQRMYDWVNSTLDAGDRRRETGRGLFWDKIRGDGSIDRTLWSYNQGSMIGLNVLLARAHPLPGTGPAPSDHLGRAEEIARRALRGLADELHRQPSAFNAILFRNLLGLSAVTADEGLRHRIHHTMAAYADEVWTRRRRDDDLILDRHGRVTLLEQAGLEQTLALLAWPPAEYHRLA